MPHIIRKLHIERRAFLRGVGAAIALPWLDAMCPALSRHAAVRPTATRALFIFAPNGVQMDQWRPRASGDRWELPPTLEPLAALRDQVTVLSGLDLEGATSGGDGPGDHARAAAAYLTCSRPFKTGGADIRVGVSVDQVMARARGRHTRFASLELGLEGGRLAGVCDSGYSCAYSNNVAWRTPSTPVAKERDPRAVFSRLFGDPGGRDAAHRARRQQSLRSVLDAVRADARGLEGRLGPADRQKLEQYLTAVRELEQRLQRAELKERARPRIPTPAGLLGSRRAADRLSLMHELIALAFQTDATRTITLMLGNAGTERTHPELGIRDGHHYLSHHGGDRAKRDKIARIDRHYVAQLATLLARLRNTEDGGQNLLDRSIVVYGSGIADGNAHAHRDLPILLAGGGNGQLGRGQHVECARGTPLANLYLSLLRRVGIQQDRFADSTGDIPELGAARGS